LVTEHVEGSVYSVFQFIHQDKTAIHSFLVIKKIIFNTLVETILTNFKLICFETKFLAQKIGESL